MTFFQLEIGDDDTSVSKRASITGVEAGAGTALGVPGGASATSAEVSVASAAKTLNEELDNLMDISIEIASNKRMKKDHIRPLRLTFKDKDLEKRVSSVDFAFLKEKFHNLGPFYSTASNVTTPSSLVFFAWSVLGSLCSSGRSSRSPCTLNGKWQKKKKPREKGGSSLFRPSGG